MSVRRQNIEEQAKRLRNYVSEAVRVATGEHLPMTQTLDQMVRSAAKAGVTLHIATGAQLHAIEVIQDQLRIMEIERSEGGAKASRKTVETHAEQGVEGGVQ